MLEKFKRHCNNPITWGKYYKINGIIVLLYAAFFAIYAGYAYLNSRIPTSYTFRRGI